MPATFIGSLARCPDVVAQGPGRRQLIRPECPFSRFILWPETPLGSADGADAPRKTAPVLFPGGGLSLDAIPKISPHSADGPRRARCPIPPPVGIRQTTDFRTRRSKVGEKSTSPWRSMARRRGATLSRVSCLQRWARRGRGPRQTARHAFASKPYKRVPPVRQQHFAGRKGKTRRPSRPPRPYQREWRVDVRGAVVGRVRVRDGILRGSLRMRPSTASLVWRLLKGDLIRHASAVPRPRRQLLRSMRQGSRSSDGYKAASADSRTRNRPSQI